MLKPLRRDYSLKERKGKVDHCRTYFYFPRIPMSANSVLHVYHWLTCSKGIHQFRYFLPQCVHQILLLAAHAYMHFDCNQPLMRTPDVRIECLIAILRQNAYMHEQTTIGFAQRKYLNQCTPFGHVSQWLKNMKMADFSVLLDGYCTLKTAYFYS